MESLVYFFFVVTAALAAAGGVLAYRAGGAWLKARRERVLDSPLLAGARVLADVQGRALDQFVAHGLKGTQTRSALHDRRVRIAYTIKRLPNGIEHRFCASLEGTGARDASAAARELGELAGFAVYLAMLTRLEPPVPLDLDVAQHSLGVTRVLSEDQTRAMQRQKLKVPTLAEAEALSAKAAPEAKAVRREVEAGTSEAPALRPSS